MRDVESPSSEAEVHAQSTLCFFLRSGSKSQDEQRPKEEVIQEGNEIAPSSPKIIVTAASSEYLDRLANLIGSIHFWEKSFRIVVYDLGLEEESRRMVRSWDNVVLKEIDVESRGLPEHFASPPLVAYKAWAVIDAMKEYGVKEGGVVFWIDANTEIRRGLAKVQDSVRKDGYFFTGECSRLRRVRLWKGVQSGSLTKKMHFLTYFRNLFPQLQVTCFRPFATSCRKLWPSWATMKTSRSDRK